MSVRVHLYERAFPAKPVRRALYKALPAMNLDNHTQVAYTLYRVEFIEAPTFTVLVAEYLDDDEYRALQLFLATPRPVMSCRGPVAFGSCGGLIDDVARASAAA